VLGTEPQVIQEYVQTGKVKLIFWPVLNHSDPSVYATLTAQCVGSQDPDKFWDVHELLFTNQAELWRADRDYFVNTAVAAGADQASFELCYDDPAALEEVLTLDAIRLKRGIAGQPMFDIAGTIYGRAPPYESFAEVLDFALKTAAK
jgi:protein-disulfide isomerase